MKLIFKCMFSPLVNEEIFKQIKEESGITLLEYDSDELILHGGKPQLVRALSLLAERDLVVIDFSNCVSDSMNIKTIKTIFRKAKKVRLSSLLDEQNLPVCLGNMSWRFTTPRTTVEQDKNTVSCMMKCISCNFSDVCFNFSVLQKLEELKWYKNEPV